MDVVLRFQSAAIRRKRECCSEYLALGRAEELRRVAEQLRFLGPFVAATEINGCTARICRTTSKVCQQNVCGELQ